MCRNKPPKVEQQRTQSISTQRTSTIAIPEKVEVTNNTDRNKKETKGAVKSRLLKGRQKLFRWIMSAHHSPATFTYNASGRSLPYSPQFPLRLAGCMLGI